MLAFKQHSNFIWRSNHMSKMGALKMRLPRRSNFANGLLNSYDYFNRTSPKYNLQKSTKCKEKKELPASAALNMIFFSLLNRALHLFLTCLYKMSQKLAAVFIDMMHGFRMPLHSLHKIFFRCIDGLNNSILRHAHHA